MSNFRAYLDALRRAGQLMHVAKPVSPDFEVAAYVRKSSDTDGPAFLFENVSGHPGWKLAAGLYGTIARLAVVLGAGPFVELGSEAKIPHAQEKLGVAGALAGRPVELVACKPVDAEVPADAESVIEGHCVPGLREPAGPFGEVAGTYGLLD